MTRCTTCKLLIREPYKDFCNRVGGVGAAEAYHHAFAMDLRKNFPIGIAIYCYGQEPDFVCQTGEELVIENLEEHEIFSQEHDCTYYQPSTGQISMDQAIINYQELKKTMKGKTEVIANQSIVNIGSTIIKATQNLQTAPTITDSSRAQISALFDELKKALESVPAETAKDAKIVAVKAETLSKELAKPKPRNRELKISSAGLLEAASAIAQTVPKVLGVAKEIATFVGEILG